MAVSDQQVETVDHRAEAEGLLRWLGDLRDKPTTDDPRTPPVLAAAELHASLAIAEQLERLNEGLRRVEKQVYEHLQSQPRPDCKDELEGDGIAAVVAEAWEQVDPDLLSEGDQIRIRYYSPRWGWTTVHRRVIRKARPGVLLLDARGDDESPDEYEWTPEGKECRHVERLVHAAANQEPAAPAEQESD